MGSQFVDFNADGHVDYLSATFDGSPHISYGSKEGFSEPVRLKDANGKRILISSFWNYEDREHQTTDRSIGKAVQERCISALAFDWDADGDYDLLLGSYENGHLYRQMNEGSNAEPKFTGKCIPVMAGGQPFALAHKMTAPRLVDWDGDGDLDLIAGSFGDSYSQNGTGGGVYLARNQGEVGKPVFGALEPLIEPHSNGGTECSRPNAGLYADVVDYDGDGDLDLIVGAYSMWTPKGKKLNDAEKATVAKLRKELAKAQQKSSAFLRKISDEAKQATAGLDPKSKEWRTTYSAVYSKYNDERVKLLKPMQAIQKELGKLIPQPKREPFVWLYERLSQN